MQPIFTSLNKCSTNTCNSRLHSYFNIFPNGGGRVWDCLSRQRRWGRGVAAGVSLREDWVYLRQTSPRCCPGLQVLGHAVLPQSLVFPSNKPGRLSSIRVRAPGRPRRWVDGPLPHLIYTQHRGSCRSSFMGKGRHSLSPRDKLTRTA